MAIELLETSHETDLGELSTAGLLQGFVRGAELAQNMGSPYRQPEEALGLSPDEYLPD